MVTELEGARSAQAEQQPAWCDESRLHWARNELTTRPALVEGNDVRRLRRVLSAVARGHAHVIQAGDCAEAPEECTPGYIARKAGLLDVLAGTMKMVTHKPAVRVGRVAGQFAKPRSKPTETVGGVELPAYRGHLVNSPEPDPVRRIPDPVRLVTGYLAAGAAMRHLGWGSAGRSALEPPIWTSHEALLLDYEIPLLREDGGQRFLGSTHWPWIGERTRRSDGAHVALLSEVANPVACKVGPAVAEDELVALCDRLDPEREPGRLTLIARMGTAAAADRLPPLVEAVRDAGHRVIWLCDPMHGNTVQTPDSFKTRYLESITREVRAFQHAVSAAGGVAGGLHLETTPDHVTECVLNESYVDYVGEKYTSFCDPRLNPEQAMSVVSAWRG